MSTWRWIAGLVAAAVAGNEVGYRSGKRAGMRMVGQAIREGLGDLVWGAATSETPEATSHAPREADSGWRENDDYRSTHDALSAEQRRGMGFTGGDADAST